MARTLDAAGKPAGGFGAEPGAAMAAHVVEGVHVAGRAARDDDALAEHLAQKKLPGRADLFGSAGAEPVAREQTLHFTAERTLVDVERGRQRGRPLRHHVTRL